MNDKCLRVKCYRFKKDLFLIDMIINDKFSNIDLMNFYVPAEGLDHSNFQVPYLEQFFEIDNDKRICEPYDEPDANLCPVRILFFIFEYGDKVLVTPYGNIDLSNPEKLPKSIKKEIFFEDVD